MSRHRWHALVGRRVVDADGLVIDHLVDLVAQPKGDRMTVSALLVGPRAVFTRIGQTRWIGADRGPVEIPWSDVVELGNVIRVRARRDDLLPTRRRRAPEGP